MFIGFCIFIRTAKSFGFCFRRKKKKQNKKFPYLHTTLSRDRWQQGGGEFAGWLLDNGLIDQMKIKLNPIILGNGIPLFGNSTTRAKWNLIKTESFEEGLKILTYEIES
ncbi:dihydrofolate reductase family protein [Maribacter dokdonensis]|uniref:dihydrofolate reductase family protein n=1 Tax=Maribacter dokdonensis TaxID=320912 RepID=UPI000ADCE2DE|nr:dihydrofolate reductase family protein [Maribacter dokdonensis]